MPELPDRVCPRCKLTGGMFRDDIPGRGKLQCDNCGWQDGMPVEEVQIAPPAAPLRPTEPGPAERLERENTRQAVIAGGAMPTGGTWVLDPTTGGFVLQAPEPETGPPCSKCGLPLPPLPPELAKAARANPGATFQHEVCPDQEPAQVDLGRYFEVRVQVVEVTETPEAAVAGDGVEVIELVSFKHGERGPDLDSVMRPLAEGLGKKWLEAEKQANVADSETTITT